MTGAAAQPAEPVDLALALERVLGDKVLLARVLARFRDEYRGAARAIGAAHAAGELEEARRQAHTLKGAAAMIGATALHREALALELRLRERSHESAAQLARLESELERVMRSLDEMLDAG
ncbi:MAG TPA: Hpt domain-containing protein [Telluria sp.]|nr:Hpt domain-containing protein [Telluria sp.]